MLKEEKHMIQQNSADKTLRYVPSGLLLHEAKDMQEP